MKTILKKIQSNTQPQAIYQLIVEEACIWALCGCVEAANSMLEKVWDLDLRPDGNTKYSEGALKMLWQASGHFPTNIPISIPDTTAIVQENWGRHFWPHQQSQSNYQESIQEKDWTQLSGTHLRLYAIALAYDAEQPNQVVTQDRLMTSIHAIDKYLDERQAVGHDLMSTLICAAILSATLDLKEKAAYYLTEWAKAFKLFWMNSSPAWLMRDQKVAQILATGLLAPVFNLNAQKCKARAQEINRALEERWQKGPSLPFGQMSWTNLIDRLIQSASESEYFELPAGMERSTFQEKQEPVNAKAIGAAESRLQVKLPDAYLQFLKVTNGLPSYNSTCPNIHPIQDIDWFRSLDPEAVEDWTSTLEEFEPETAAELARSLLIGGYQEEQQLLLIPSDSEQEWACWFFASWNQGPTEYKSFRYYLENELMSLEEDQQ
ncbi:MAG: SMI1/KNR4 family protein [Bacteroidota bacterium]